MRPLLAIALLSLVAVAFAGCAEDPERYPNGVPTTSSTSRSATGSSSRSATGSSSASGSSTGPAGNATDNETDANAAPVANLTATPLNGTAPLEVQFSLSGTDPDGDGLAWVLEFGDGNRTNGTALPTSVNHTYGTGGHRAVLTVSDGNQSATTSVTITVGTSEDPFAFCNRPDAVMSPSGHYLDVRELPPNYSIWIYEESNGKEGMQAGGSGEEAAYANCPDPDTLIF